MKVLFLIAARGGSKGVPRKNIKVVGDFPLIAYKIFSAKQSKYCSRLIVSTDDNEITDVARKYGAEVPFVRPEELASDATSSMEVVKHAIEWIESETDERYDAMMLLEPSSPFAKSVDYDRAINLLMKNDANVVLGMREVEVNSCFIGNLDVKGRLPKIIDNISQIRSYRRQDVEQEYTMNGAFYLAKWDFLKKYNDFYVDRENTYGVVMDRYHSIEIDELIDLKWAEFLFDKGYLNSSDWEKRKC